MLKQEQELGKAVITIARDMVERIIAKSKKQGFPLTWDSNYWHGYCDALDSSGELWKFTLANVLRSFNVLHSRRQYDDFKEYEFDDIVV